MITTSTWVPRGFAAPFPQKYNFDEEEFERIASLAKLKLDDAHDDLEEARAKDGDDGSEKDEKKKETADTKEEYASQPALEKWCIDKAAAVLRSTTT